MNNSIKSQIKILLTLLITLQINNAKAQYHVETFPKTMTSILGHPDATTVIHPTTMNTEAMVSLPFTFTYFNQNHDSIDINSNGFISFTPLTGTEFDYFNQPLPHVHKPDGVVALFWDDLSVYGSISYLIEGIAPNRKMIIEYSSLGDLAGNTNILTGQIHLYETTNFIEFHYGTNASSSIFPTATIGLENHDASIGIGGPNNDSNNNIPSDNYRFKPHQYNVSGEIYGLLNGNELLIQNNGSDTLTVYSNGSFTMPSQMHEGAMYNISLASTPDNQDCYVNFGTGTMGHQNVDNIVIFCSSTINTETASFSYLHQPNNTNGIPLIDFSLSGHDYTNTDWWYYRMAGDTREYVMPKPNQLYASNSILILRWFDVDNRGLFDAEVRISLSQTNPDGAMLKQEFKLTNLTNQESTIELFKYTDYDLSNLALDDATLENHPDYIKITGNDGKNTLFAEIRAGDNDSYQVANPPSFYSIFGNEMVDNLTNTGLPINNNDFAGAFQWHHTIPANGWITSITTAAIGTASAEEPADPIVFGLPRTISFVVQNLVHGNEFTFQLNGTDDITVSSNGNYTFSTPVVDGDTYHITVLDPSPSITQKCNPNDSTNSTVWGEDVEIGYECKFVPGEINDGSAKFTYHNNYNFGQTRFSIDNTFINIANWYYRTDIDSREIAFPVADTSTYNGNSVILDWFDVDNRGLFSAQLVQTIEQEVATGGIVTNTLTIKSLVPIEANINIFNYADFDIDGRFNDEAVLLSSDNNYIGIINNVTQNAINMAEFRAGTGTSYQLGEYLTISSIIDMLMNDDVDNLNNTGSPFGPADVEAAFQWSYPVPAYGSLTIQTIYAGGSSIAPVPTNPVVHNPIIFKNGFETP